MAGKVMSQYARWPDALDELVSIARAFPGWDFQLRHEERGQGCGGLTLEIRVIGPDSKDPDGPARGVRHLFVVPAAAYNTKSWKNWIYQRCQDVLTHELGEWLHFGDEQTFAPNHGAGHDPYFTYVVSTETERDTEPGT